MRKLLRASGAAFVTVMVVGCTEAPTVKSRTQISSGAGNRPALSESKMDRLRQYSDGGCAISGTDSSGATRGFPILHKDVPFLVAPIRYDSVTNRGNGRVSTIKLERPGKSPAIMSCWIPNTVSAADIAKSIGASKKGRWSALLSGIARGTAIPNIASRGPLSAEAKAFEAELLASDSEGRSNTDLRVAPTSGSANFNEWLAGCESATITWNEWQDNEYVTFTVTVSLCSYGDDDFMGWLIDNGYGSVPTLWVDATAYVDTTGDSVTFYANINSPGLVSRIGWNWVSDNSSVDPWTSACDGNDTTCTVPIFGGGTMQFTIYDMGTGEDVTQGAVVGPLFMVPIDSAPWAGVADVPSSSSGSSTLATHPVSLTTGKAILANAEAQPKWKYTQGCRYCVPGGPTEPPKDLPNHVGDCTDFVWQVVHNVLGSTAWPYDNDIPRTADFAAFVSNNRQGYYGYVHADSATSQEGDVVVQLADTAGKLYGGHAGIFFHFAASPKGKMSALLYANNGAPVVGMFKPDSSKWKRYYAVIRQDYDTLVYYRAATP